MHQVEHCGKATIIHVNGELDVVSASALAAIIKLAHSEDAQRIIVSLERCAYCYSAGLAVLARAQKSIGTTLFVVVPAKAQFRRMFEVTGLAHVLRLVPTMQRALDAEYDLDLQHGSHFTSAPKNSRRPLRRVSSSS